jgi:hypothetical protein
VVADLDRNGSPSAILEAVNFLRLQFLSLVLNPKDFALTTNCITILGEGANCSITTSFQPSATRYRWAKLRITCNALGRSQTVALQGTGQ